MTNRTAHRLQALIDDPDVRVVETEKGVLLTIDDSIGQAVPLEEYARYGAAIESLIGHPRYLDRAMQLYRLVTGLGEHEAAAVVNQYRDYLTERNYDEPPYTPDYDTRYEEAAAMKPEWDALEAAAEAVDCGSGQAEDKIHAYAVIAWLPWRDAVARVDGAVKVLADRKVPAEEGTPDMRTCEEVEAYVGKGVVQSWDYTFTNHELVPSAPGGQYELWRAPLGDSAGKPLTLYAVAHKDGKPFFSTLDRDLAEIVRDEVEDRHLDLLVTNDRGADAVAVDVVEVLRAAHEILTGEDGRECVIVVSGHINGTGSMRIA